MTLMRTALLALVLVLLTLAAAASATQQVGSGTATITGSGTSWSLTIANTGTEAIKCWRYTFPPGIQATAIRNSPTGWQVGGNKPPPAPILGGRSDAGIAPSGRATFGFTTTRAFDTGRRLSGVSADPPGITAGSTDCVSDFNIPTDYGSSPPPPQPKPKPCKCKTLDVEIPVLRHPEIVRSTAGGLSIDFWLKWVMDCTNGAGRCRGTVTASPTVGDRASGLRVKRLKGKNRTGVIDCEGPCSRLNGGNVHFRLLGGANFGEAKLGKSVRVITLEVDRFCSRDLAPRTLDFVFGRDYRGEPEIDFEKSDLNGNGIRDGKEKKK